MEFSSGKRLALFYQLETKSEIAYKGMSVVGFWIVVLVRAFDKDRNEILAYSDDDVRDLEEISNCFLVIPEIESSDIRVYASKYCYPKEVFVNGVQVAKADAAVIGFRLLIGEGEGDERLVLPSGDDITMQEAVRLYTENCDNIKGRGIPAFCYSCDLYDPSGYEKEKRISSRDKSQKRYLLVTETGGKVVSTSSLEKSR